MSTQQNPPVTVITIPPETPRTTTASTTTTPDVVPTTIPDVVPTTIPDVVPTTIPDVDAPSTVGQGLTATSVATPGAAAPAASDASITMLVGFGLLVVLVFAVVAWRSARTRRSPPVVLPGGTTLTERVRQAVARAEREEPGQGVALGDVSVADLYPWIEPPQDLTLVVDLRTAEALQEVGVTSLDQLARMDDDTVRSMVDAGIDIDTRAVEAAAQDILTRRKHPGEG